MKNIKNKTVAFFIILCCLSAYFPAYAETAIYPDYAYEFLGEDKYENYNRKMFGFNQKLNKYLFKPIHILWASIVPQYGMDRILGISKNVEYPVRFVSCVCQGQFREAGQETVRFLVNTTVGLGGMFDPAKRFLNIEQVNENMDQALAKWHIKSKRFFVLPVISFTTYRGLAGRVLDAALNPSTYIGTPILAAIKAGLTVNRTTYIQLLIKMLEDNFPDPYEVYKTIYGIDMYAKQNNIDRVDVISQLSTDPNIKKRKKKIKKQKIQESHLKVSASIDESSIYEDTPDKNFEIITTTEEIDIPEEPVKKTKKTKVKNEEKIDLKSDIIIKGYNSQNPFTDSTRTMLFKVDDSEDSIWNELSIWNRSFKNTIKLSEINLAPGRKNYKFRYILQKNKKAPLAVIYPSTGAGVMSNHPVMFAKLFYDAGYSVLIIGNPFQWEFAESMPVDYRPGLPVEDAKALRMATGKIIKQLENKYRRHFNNKVILGTSYGGMTALFMAEQESLENTLGNVQYISICPPVDLFYSANLLDDTYKRLNISKDELKNKIATVLAKTLKLYQEKKDIDFLPDKMPYTEEESKFLTSYLMHQKLSDVIFVIENAPTNKKSDIYKKTNSIGFKEYSEQYLLTYSNELNKKIVDNSKLTYIRDYLQHADNYIIYHTQNDYLVTKYQLNLLKQMSKDKMYMIDNGSHMGFLYRPEFIQELFNTMIAIKQDNNL